MTISKRGILALALVAAGVVASLAGCTTVVSSPANAGQNTGTAPGTGTYSAVPDQAGMSFGVSASAKDAKSARDQVSTKADKVSSAIKGAGVADKDIQTANVSIDPQYPNTPSSPPRIIGYQASLTVRAKVRDLGSLSKVITAATAAGLDNVNGPQFSIADDSPDRAKAIQLAVDDARRTAEALAKAAGKAVGAVVSISAADVTSPIRNFDAYLPMATAKASVPIQPGQLDVNSQVTVVFELK